MKKMVNGKEVIIDALEAAEIQAEWDANEQTQAQLSIDNAKQEQKDKLVREKIESMLTVEFAEIDAATTKIAAKSVTLKG